MENSKDIHLYFEYFANIQFIEAILYTNLRENRFNGSTGYHGAIHLKNMKRMAIYGKNSEIMLNNED